MAAKSATVSVMPGAASAPPPAPRKSSILPMMMMALLAVGGSAGSAWFVASRSAAAAAAAAPAADAAHGKAGKSGAKTKPHYLALDPAFVVNLSDTDMPRYLQVDVQVMARKEAVLEEVEANMPVIRNGLLMLFAQQRTTDLADRAGRERLQAAALADVRKSLESAGADDAIEALYFTSFVMQ